MNPSTFVIAIAGHSGAGKSTAIEHLVQRLGEANSLSLAAYRSTSIYPESAKWIEEGANPNAFKMPRYDEAVRALKNGKAVLHPERESNSNRRATLSWKNILAGDAPRFVT